MKKRYNELSTQEKDEIVNWYTDHSYTSIETKYNITRNTLFHIIDEYNLKKHSKEDNIKFTMRERYGADNITQSEYYKTKIANRSKEDVDLSTAKRKETNKKKYGYEHVLQVPQIQKKLQETCLERYGSTNFATSDGFGEYQRECYIKKWGVSHTMKLDEFKNRYKETCQRHWGVDNYAQSDDFKAKLSTKVHTKYSDTSFADLFDNRDKSIQFLTSGDYSATDIASLFNITLPAVEAWLVRNDLKDYIKHKKSHYEDDIHCLFNNFRLHDKIALNNKQEIDLYDPTIKVGIEFNGTYWHSSFSGTPNNYHQNKSKQAEKQGIRLIHIYEYEWNDERIQPIIISIINHAIGKKMTHIYARNCTIQKITNKEARSFNNNNHLQGHRNAKVTYGLFYQNEIVQLMSFSNSTYNRNLQDNQWEIIRECSKQNLVIVGGKSKLFKHFIREYNPNAIFTYCDFNKFTGISYEQLGMKFIGYTAPDFKWIIDGNVYSRNPTKHHEMKERAQGVIYGAGSKKYLWKNDSECC